MASSAERAIRDDLVSWWHANEPRGRVVHELPLSGFSDAGRADLGIIFPDSIVLIEIKSERDKLDRLEKQMTAMSQRSHHWFAVCHERWFKPDCDDLIGQDWMKWSHREHVWRWPGPRRFNRYTPQNWTPNPYFLIDMLWADELRTAFNLCGLSAPPKQNPMWQNSRDLGHAATGAQITKAVCAALRGRVFAEADPVTT